MAFQNPKPVLFDEPSNSVPVHLDNNPLQESNDYNVHDNVFFVFIDVLGFSKTFEDNRESATVEFASKYRKTFTYYTKLTAQLKNSYGQNLVEAGQTSDSLFFYTDRADILMDFIKLFNHFNLYAMSQDVFFRGGISKGKLFIEEPHHFYGDCVIKSFLLESKIAKFPRVMVDHATYAALSKEGDLGNLIIADADKTRFYINPFVYAPLSTMQADFPYLKHVLREVSADDWKEIESNINKGYIQFEFDEKNYPKYCFLQKAFKTALITPSSNE